MQVVQFTSQDHISSERIDEQSVEVLALGMLKQFIDPRKSWKNSARWMCLRFLKDIVEASQPAPQERSQERVMEPMILFFVPQVVEDFVELYQIMSNKHISERNVEHMVDVPMSEIWNEIVEAIQLVLCSAAIN